MKCFEEGDFVWVVMTTNDCFGFQNTSRFIAKVLHRPRDTGDIWYFNRFGVSIAINPMSSDFIGLEQVVEEEEEE